MKKSLKEKEEKICFENIINKYSIPENKIPVFKAYLKYLWRDISDRSDEKLKGIDKYSFYKYYKLPGVMTDRLFKVLNTSKSGYLSRKEFLHGMISLFTGNYKDCVKLIFDIYDFNEDGYVNKEDIRIILSYLPLNSEKKLTYSHFKFEKQDFIDRIESQEELDMLLKLVFHENPCHTLSTYLDYIEKYSSETFIYLLIFILESKPFSFHSVFEFDSCNTETNYYNNRDKIHIYEKNNNNYNKNNNNVDDDSTKIFKHRNSLLNVNSNNLLNRNIDFNENEKNKSNDNIHNENKDSFINLSKKAGILNVNTNTNSDNIKNTASITNLTSNKFIHSHSNNNLDKRSQNLRDSETNILGDKIVKKGEKSYNPLIKYSESKHVLQINSTNSNSTNKINCIINNNNNDKSIISNTKKRKKLNIKKNQSCELDKMDNLVDYLDKCYNKEFNYYNNMVNKETNKESSNNNIAKNINSINNNINNNQIDQSNNSLFNQQSKTKLNSVLKQNTNSYYLSNNPNNNNNKKLRFNEEEKESVKSLNSNPQETSPSIKNKSIKKNSNKDTESKLKIKRKKSKNKKSKEHLLKEGDGNEYILDNTSSVNLVFNNKDKENVEIVNEPQSPVSNNTNNTNDLFHLNCNTNNNSINLYSNDNTASTNSLLRINKDLLFKKNSQTSIENNNDIFKPKTSNYKLVVNTVSPIKPINKVNSNMMIKTKSKIKNNIDDKSKSIKEPNNNIHNILNDLNYPNNSNNPKNLTILNKHSNDNSYKTEELSRSKRKKNNQLSKSSILSAQEHSKSIITIKSMENDSNNTNNNNTNNTYNITTSEVSSIIIPKKARSRKNISNIKRIQSSKQTNRTMIVEPNIESKFSPSKILHASPEIRSKNKKFNSNLNDKETFASPLENLEDLLVSCSLFNGISNKVMLNSSNKESNLSRGDYWGNDSNPEYNFVSNSNQELAFTQLKYFNDIGNSDKSINPYHNKAKGDNGANNNSNMISDNVVAGRNRISSTNYLLDNYQNRENTKTNGSVTVMDYNYDKFSFVE